MTDELARLTSALANRYTIERELGAGGMATVYLAEDLKHKRKVAVKVLRSELAAVLGAERFVQEITTTANLQHPHILPLFDSGEADGFLYYVMPFIDGETLRDKLNRETQLGIDEAVGITTDIADALDYAHRNNVIHRDIKPENILLHDGRPMVADFGIALAVSAAAGATAGGQWTRVAVSATALAALFLVMAVWGWLRPQPEVPKPVARYSIVLPDDETPPFGTALAVSPDGSRLVYVGPGEQGGRLWVRNRDQLHATPLPGTDGARIPFFSPDGSRVGFWTFADGWRVASLGGGAPITLAESGRQAVGGSWGPDGFVYLDGPRANDALVRVAETGGALEAVTVIDSTRGESFHLWPETLPGGGGIVFSVGRGGLGNLDEWDIAVADLRNDTHTVLLRGVQARYAASGHLLYVTSDGTLMAVPFDETTLALTGDAVAIVEGLRIGFAGSVGLAVSATGTLFYTTGGVGGGGVVELVWVTRDGTAEEIDPGWTRDFRWPTLSPDGTQLAVTINGADGQQIWVKQLDRGPLPKLTSGAINNRPAWTPDGRSVAFVSFRGETRGLYVRRADGSAPAVPLHEEERDIAEVTYSPNGEWLVYRVNADTRDLYALRVGSDSAVALVATEYEETSPAVSPDGQWLAYASNESGRTDVYVRPFPNTNDFRWLVSTDGGREPVWAHSGRELFYRGNGNQMVVEVLPGPTFVTGERRALFSTQGYRSNFGHQQYDVTPDDQRFVMIRNVGAEEGGELIVVENFFEELKSRFGNE